MIFVLATKGESWNTISIIGCLKNTLTLVLLILTISIHRSAERFEEPRSSEPLKRPNLRYTFDFKFQIWNTWKIRNHDWKWKRNIFVQCLRYFTLSTLPRIVSTFTRASLSIARSSIGNEESTGIVVRVNSFTSIIWRSVRITRVKRDRHGTNRDSLWRNSFLPRFAFYKSWKTNKRVH